MQLTSENCDGEEGTRIVRVMCNMGKTFKNRPPVYYPKVACHS
jgi:hypothetical protein